MHIKLETKRNRVYGLSFHTKRPWILAGLDSGGIELWDYRLGKLIRRFGEHKGPVRGLDFHKTKALFVSGDDNSINVWNYETRKCLFTLLEHSGYIRTVQFHHEQPWIVSASDDQTIRIWNWQSRNRIAVLIGHVRSVMCASFHPKYDFLLSASLDKTVRVWDIASLLSDPANIREKYVLKGHDGGVNWASFHPTLPLIVSGSDDLTVKLWSMNETKAWEVGTLRGHMNSVSSVMFHAKQDIIVSSSEDKSIIVWDATKQTVLQTFSRLHDKFWILAVHPKMNLLAAGHDSGMVVFKLERERPAFAFSGDSLFYAKDWFLRYYEFSTQRDSQVIPIRRPATASFNRSPRSLSYSPTRNAVLICSDLDGGSYELYIIRKDTTGKRHVLQEAKRGTGGSAVFIARNWFAVLEKSTNQVLVKNLKNEVVNTGTLPITTDAIFYAGTGNLLCRSEDKVVLFHLEQGQVLGDLPAKSVRYVSWSNDMERVALLSKQTIIIASKTLVRQCILDETISVKSGVWDDNGVFIYTTLNRIKYCLPNGDSGIIKTLDVPIYITKVTANIIFCLDRDGKNRMITIDATEYIFKLSLLRNKYDNVMSMIRNSQVCGQAMVTYLQQKGLPEVALHLVEDERIQFNQALESGNISVALASATKINEKDQWYKLGVEALRQGNVGMAEYAYQQAKNFERLSFLYLITGNLEKLLKLMKIAEVKNNVMGQFHNALYLGDVKERVKILESAGHLRLAYITASVHGLHDVAERLASELGDNVPSLPECKTPSLLMPPMPVICGGDWPLFGVMKGIFEGGLEKGPKGVDVDGIQNGDVEAKVADKDGEEGGWALEDLELPPELDTPQSYLPALEEKLKAGYKATSTGKFTKALRIFRSILHTIPLVLGEPRREEVNEIEGLIIIVKEYVLGLQMELKRREMKDDPTRQQELAAYFTHCNLQPLHLRLALLSAMSVCYKAKNLATASFFATRFIATNPTVESQAETAKRVIQAAEHNMTDETKLKYDFRKSFVICGATYVPIYKGENDVSCPYCRARFVPGQEGNICSVCDLEVISADAS